MWNLVYPIPSIWWFKYRRRIKIKIRLSLYIPTVIIHPVFGICLWTACPLIQNSPQSISYLLATNRGSHSTNPKIFSHSHECGHYKVHTPLPPSLKIPFPRGMPLLLYLWKWSIKHPTSEHIQMKRLTINKNPYSHTTVQPTSWKPRYNPSPSTNHSN